MANIHDYLLWRGDLEFSKCYSFNEIDSMILARFSYLRFDLINLKKKETIGSISDKMKNLNDDVFLYKGDKELITYLGESKRFKDLIVTDYVKNTNKDKEEQFGAVTIHLSSKEIYISYIGTDSTINGWKEDFNMSFLNDVPCQIAGREYLENISTKYCNKRIRIGGHSKGGNVAIYSAISVSKRIQNRIIKVDNFDGPGLNSKVLSNYLNDSIIKKIETFIPQDSVIGRILQHKEKTTISLSYEKGIYQHDLYSWAVLKDKIVKTDSNTVNSDDINKTLGIWLEETTPQQRKIFIDSIFDLFYSTEEETFGDISKSLKSSIPKILQEYKYIKDSDKKVITDMLKLITKAYLNIVKERQIKKIDNKRNNLFN